MQASRQGRRCVLARKASMLGQVRPGSRARADNFILRLFGAAIECKPRDPKTAHSRGRWAGRNQLPAFSHKVDRASPLVPGTQWDTAHRGSWRQRVPRDLVGPASTAQVRDCSCLHGEKQPRASSAACLFASRHRTRLHGYTGHCCLGSFLHGGSDTASPCKRGRQAPLPYQRYGMHFLLYALSCRLSWTPRCLLTPCTEQIQVLPGAGSSVEQLLYIHRRFLRLITNHINLG